MREDIPLRVVIVDDDEWIRRGRETGLSDVGIEVVRAQSHDDALATEDWDVDAVVVDAYDGRRDWDRYVGVGVVEHVRRHAPERTIVLVVSGHVFDPVLRLRMAEAGANFFYGHIDLPDPASMAEALRHPDRARRPGAVDEQSLARHGLRPWSTPNAAVRLVEANGYQPLFSESTSQKSSGVGRRAHIRARDEVAAAARFDGSSPASVGAGTFQWSGRGGQWPPRSRRARAMRASALLNP